MVEEQLRKNRSWAVLFSQCCQALPTAKRIAKGILAALSRYDLPHKYQFCTLYTLSPLREPMIPDSPENHGSLERPACVQVDHALRNRKSGGGLVHQSLTAYFTLHIFSGESPVLFYIRSQLLFASSSQRACKSCLFSIMKPYSRIGVHPRSLWSEHDLFLIDTYPHELRPL